MLCRVISVSSSKLSVGCRVAIVAENQCSAGAILISVAGYINTVDPRPVELKSELHDVLN